MPAPTYTARPKRSSKRSRISIDGVDVSNAFSAFNVDSVKSTEEAGGFNPTGVTETVPGATTQGFAGTLYVSAEEVVDMLWDLHVADTVVEIQFQENGLVDTSAPVWYGNCTINEMHPAADFSGLSTMPFAAITADSAGITKAAGT